LDEIGRGIEYACANKKGEFIMNTWLIDLILFVITYITKKKIRSKEENSWIILLQKKLHKNGASQNAEFKNYVRKTVLKA